MKKTLLLLLLLVCFQQAGAQLFTKERIANDASGGKGDLDNHFLTWGYYLGFNRYDFKFEYNEQFNDRNTDVRVETQMGFNVGLVGDLRLGKHINLRLEPGIFYTQRNFIFPRIGDEQAAFRESKSTYVHLPLLLKLSTKRKNNFKPFIIGGLSTSLNLSANQNNPDDNSRGQFRMKKYTNYYELGFGVDLYLYYFKFTPSVRGIFATSNELVPDDSPSSAYTGNISYMGTSGVFINFTFQ